MQHADESTRISLITLLGRGYALGAAEVTIETWLRASGWRHDPSNARYPWQDPHDVDSWTLRDAARCQAQTSAARLLRKRGWVVGTVGPGAGAPGWCESPVDQRRQVTLITALRAEGLDGVTVRAP